VSVFVSRDGAQSWQPVDSSLLKRQAVHSLAAVIAGVDPVKVFAGTDRGIVISGDAGKTWSSPSGLPTWPVRSLEARAITQPNTTAVILAGGDGGVAWSINRGLTWQQAPREIKDIRGAALAPDGQSFLAFRAVDLLAYDQLFQP
jgi:hypothetical protein